MREEIELADLLASIVLVDPLWDRMISGIAIDSRKVQEGYLFIAYPGIKNDGRAFIDEAIAKGAKAVLAETSFASSSEVSIRKQVPIFWAQQVARKISLLASRFYQHPSRMLDIVGITGTNGKTSCCYYLAQALQDKPCGVIGTLGNGIWPELAEATQTTPEPTLIQSMLAEFVEREIPCVAMEISSHALDQARVQHVEVDYAIFTNLTRDHLDYHKTMQAYGLAKLTLFQKFGLRYAILNLDDSFSETIMEQCPKSVKILTYSVKSHEADCRVENIVFNPQGVTLSLVTPGGSFTCTVPLYGIFNVSNILAVATTLYAMGYANESIKQRLKAIKNVPGRMQAFLHPSGSRIVVDYAHTPDALEKALLALRQHFPGQALWCVFGCGGGRDEGKRADMGLIAEHLADHVILTTDNPRYDDPVTITEQTMAGMRNRQTIKCLLEREAAIRYAMDTAAPGSVILVAGKGHESYQEIKGERRPYSDIALLQSLCVNTPTQSQA